MNCQDCQDLLLLYATGSLDPAETAAVRAHLATGCPNCAAELAAAEATLHKVPLGLPLQQAPESAWEKLETRIALKDQADGSADGTGTAPDRTALAAPFTRRGPSAFAWVSWAAAAVVAVTMGVLWKHADDENQINKLKVASLEALVKNSDSRLDNLAQQMKTLSDQNTQLIAADASLSKQLQDQLDTLLQSDQFAIAGQTPEQTTASGKLYWNKTSQTWQIYLTSVKPAPAGKTYELWIVSGNDKLAAGTAQADDKGRLVFQTTRKIPADASLAAITDEAAPGEPDNGAKGQIQFLAKLTP